eukprot:3769061-Karenia_brevis.AAC.1
MFDLYKATTCWQTLNVRVTRVTLAEIHEALKKEVNRKIKSGRVKEPAVEALIQRMTSHTVKEPER